MTEKSTVDAPMDQRLAASDTFPQSAFDLVFRNNTPGEKPRLLPSHPEDDEDVMINRVFPLDGGLI